MTLRAFIDLMCIALQEKYSIKVAKEIINGFSTIHDPFEMYLIRESDNDTEKIENRLKSYLRSGRNISRDFAIALRDVCEREQVIKYLNGTFYDDESMDWLCRSFGAVCPGINRENAIDLVADLFRKVLDDASKENRSNSKSSRKGKWKLSKIERLELLKMIDELKEELDTLEELMAWHHVERLPSSLSRHEIDFEFNESRKDFRETNEQLQKFNVLHPELTLLKKLHDLFKMIKYKSEIELIDGCRYVKYESAFVEYRNTVEDPLESLTTA